MDARGVRRVVANLKKASADFRNLHDAATSTMHVDDVRNSNVARSCVEGIVEELDDIERIPGIDAKLLASVQDNLAAARRLLQSRRVIVGMVSPLSRRQPQGGAVEVDDQAPLAAAPSGGMDPHFRAPLRVPSVASVASNTHPRMSAGPSGSRSPSIASSTVSVRRERAQILGEARRRKAENLARILEEEKDAEEQAKVAEEQARVALVAAEKVRRMAKNKAIRERQQAEDEYEFSEMDADEVVEEAGVDSQTLRDRLVDLRDGGSGDEDTPSGDDGELSTRYFISSGSRRLSSPALSATPSPPRNLTSSSRRLASLSPPPSPPPPPPPPPSVRRRPSVVSLQHSPPSSPHSSRRVLAAQEKRDAELARRLQEEEKGKEAVRRGIGRLEVDSGSRRNKVSRQLAQAAASAPVPESYPASSSASQVPSTAVDQLYLLEVLKNRRPTVKFTGGSFDAFEAHHQSFLSAVDIDGISSSTKMRELSSWYGGAAGKVVSRFIRRKDFDQAYLEVIKELKSLWGMRLTTAPEMLSSILQGKPISNSNVSAIRMFFIELGNVYQLAVETGRAVDFNRRSVHDDVLAKLPQWKSKWVEKRAKLEVAEVDKLTFSKLLDFIRQRLRVLEESTPLPAVFVSSAVDAKVVNEVASAGAPANAATTSRRNRGRKWSPRRTTSPVSSTTSNLQPEAKSCVCCSAPHFVENCRTFKGLSAADRADIARRCGLCYSCLDQGHTTSSCVRKKSCATCKNNHHDLMHEWLTANPISSRIQSAGAAI